MTRKITKQELLKMCFSALLTGAKTRKRKESGQEKLQMQRRYGDIRSSLGMGG
jgi:hypothetical protein